jgi:hypothetical protein
MVIHVLSLFHPKIRQDSVQYWFIFATEKKEYPVTQSIPGNGERDNEKKNIENSFHIYHRICWQILIPSKEIILDSFDFYLLN